MAVSRLDRIIDQYHAAFDEFVNGSPTSLQKLFSHRDDVSLANPIAPAARGWKEVSETQARASSQFQKSGPTVVIGSCRPLHIPGAPARMTFPVAAY